MHNPEATPQTAIRRILLVHGLLNANYWLWRLAARMRAEGFEAEIFGYSSLLDGPEQAIPALVERLRRGPFDALVGHSLGGLISMEALRRAPGLPVARVVCLGSPLLGSDTARNLAAHAWGRPLLGRSGPLLTRGLERWDGPAEAGMIAGDVARGMGKLFSRFDGPSDGTVGLHETRLPGLADHCIVHDSHTGLVFSAEAAAQAAHFLREGRFRRPPDGGV